LRRQALSRALSATSDLRVDLSGLRFADSSLMLDLVMVARRLRQAGRLMRVSGAQPQIDRLIALCRA
jgi:anti-anti-sigma regulatory factor